MDNRLRATDAERSKALDILSQAFTHGQLDMVEFDERSATVARATYRDELSTPLQDLVADPAKAVLPAPLRGEGVTSRAQVTPGTTGDSFSLSLLSSHKRHGQWTVAKKHTALTVLGDTTLDLTRAQFADHTITIDAYAVLGDITIIVPDDVRVVAPGFAILGEFSVKNEGQARADGASISVRGMAVLGSVTIKRRAR